MCSFTKIMQYFKVRNITRKMTFHNDKKLNILGIYHNIMSLYTQNIPLKYRKQILTKLYEKYINP